MSVQSVKQNNLVSFSPVPYLHLFHQQSITFPANYTIWHIFTKLRFQIKSVVYSRFFFLKDSSRYRGLFPLWNLISVTCRHPSLCLCLLHQQVTQQPECPVPTEGIPWLGGWAEPTPSSRTPAFSSRLEQVLLSLGSGVIF